MPFEHSHSHIGGTGSVDSSVEDLHRQSPDIDSTEQSTEPRSRSMSRDPRLSPLTRSDSSSSLSAARRPSVSNRMPGGSSDSLGSMPATTGRMPAANSYNISPRRMSTSSSDSSSLHRSRSSSSLGSKSDFGADEHAYGHRSSSYDHGDNSSISSYGRDDDDDKWSITSNEPLMPRRPGDSPISDFGDDPLAPSRTGPARPGNFSTQSHEDIHTQPSRPTNRTPGAANQSPRANPMNGPQFNNGNGVQQQPRSLTGRLWNGFKRYAPMAFNMLGDIAQIGMSLIMTVINIAKTAASDAQKASEKV